MNNIEYVTTLLESMIQQGRSKAEIVRSVAIACEGWPYVFGAWGEQCTPSGRRRRVRDDHPTIVTACQVLSGKKSVCDGCKWDLPVRMFDCRGFTDWCLKQVGIDLKGEGATSQWNTKSNWVLKGSISEMPKDKVCCVFVQKGNTMQHTGLYLGDGGTCECSSGVQYFKVMKSKWTHYAVPAGLYDETPTPQPPDPDKKPTLRRGDAGPYVTLAQTQLIQRGYDLGSYGADGKFGAKTEEAVKAFQRDWDLTQDGVIGPVTWSYLSSTPVKIEYTVTIPHLSLKDAEALAALYNGAVISKEGDQ
jgi:hypothetical protein